MSKKVKVNENVFCALKDLLSRNKKDYNYEFILKSHAENNDWTGDKWVYLNELSLSELAQAIYVGYEMEETPEEILVKAYMKYFEDDSYQCGYEDGIFFTLNVLNIKIKGIN